jgi:hypothetical protein
MTQAVVMMVAVLVVPVLASYVGKLATRTERERLEGMRYPPK